MMNVRHLLVSGLALLAATTALAADYPVAGKLLTLRRTVSGAERLVFQSNDPTLPFPAIGSADDPTSGSPGGALVEVISVNDPSVGMFAVPKGAGWTTVNGLVPRYNFSNPAAPAAPSIVKALVLQRGRQLKITAHRVGLDLKGPQGGVAIRVTFGSTRICALFSGAAVVTDVANRFTSRGLPASALADCSDATLGTAPMLSSAVISDPRCVGDNFPPPSPPFDYSKNFHRVTLSDPLAVCNDGSPAVVYIHRAPLGGGHARDWLIWLEGGGSCRDGEDCGNRWCGFQSPQYSAKVMSNRWEPASKNPQGMFDVTDVRNHFRDFNIVQVPYCSSDEWAGTHTVDIPASTLQSTPPGVIPPYRISFHGHHIVNAVIAALRAGVVATDDTGAVVESLPPLTTADRVLFSGTSGGAGGAIHNATRVTAMIRAGHPSIDVQLLSDATTRPYEPNPPEVTELEAVFRWQLQYAGNEFHAAVLNQHCMAAHPTIPGLCSQKTHVLFHHIPLRAFAQFDLRDNTAGPWAYPDVDVDPQWNAFRDATRALYQTFPSRPFPGDEPITVQELGYYAPDCRHHVTLSTDDYYQIRLGPSLQSLNDVVWDWWDAGNVPRLVDDGTPLSTICLP